MSVKTLNKAICPDCGEDVILEGKSQLGRKVTCPHCSARLEVVETIPLELDWIFEDEDFDPYEDEEDE